jgi:hypothetical protein
VSASTLTIIIGRELAGLGLGTKLHRRVVNYAFEAAIKRRFIIARKCNCRIVELDLRKTHSNTYSKIVKLEKFLIKKT